MGITIYKESVDIKMKIRSEKKTILKLLSFLYYSVEKYLPNREIISWVTMIP